MGCVRIAFVLPKPANRTIRPHIVYQFEFRRCSVEDTGNRVDMPLYQGRNLHCPDYPGFF